MKKMVALLMALCLLMGFTSFAGAESQTLTIMMSSGDYGPDTIKVALQTIADSMGIELAFDVYPDDQFLNVVNTKLATGNAGDVIVHNFGVTDVSAADLAELSGDWTGKITTTTKPLCIDANGRLVKAPLGGESNMGLIYNKKVLEASGVTLPINNYAEFVDACAKIKEAGYTPVYLSNKEVWTAQIWLLGSMTSIFADHPDYITGITTNTLKPTEIPELVKLWENALSLKELGFINSDYMSATNDMAFEALAEGECAFYAMLDNAYSTFAADYPESLDDLGMMYVPLWDNQEDGFVLFGTATNYLSAVAASVNVELAKEFINAMISEEGLTAYYNLVPGAAPYVDLDFELNMNAFNREMKEYAKTWRSLGDFNNSTYDGATPLEAFYGAFNEQVQGLFSGKSVIESLTDWYNAYAADAQARRVDGF